MYKTKSENYKYQTDFYEYESHIYKNHPPILWVQINLVKHISDHKFKVRNHKLQITNLQLTQNFLSTNQMEEYNLQHYY